MQFSIKTILLVTTLVAVAIALLFIVPKAVASIPLIIITIVLPAMLTVGIAFGRGASRAFCIGAQFPAVAALLYVFFADVNLRSDSLWQRLLYVLDQALEGQLRTASYDVGTYTDELRALSLATWVLCFCSGLACVWMHWYVRGGKD